MLPYAGNALKYVSSALYDQAGSANVLTHYIHEVMEYKKTAGDKWPAVIKNIENVKRSGLFRYG